jgi:hypothetical protein
LTREVFFVTDEKIIITGKSKLSVSGKIRIKYSARPLTIKCKMNEEMFAWPYLAGVLGKRPAVVFKDRKLVEDPAVIPFTTLQHKKPAFALLAHCCGHCSFNSV